MKMPQLYRQIMRLIIITTTLLCGAAYAQSPWDKVFNHDTLSSKNLGNYVIHYSKSTGKTIKPLLVYIDGSGNYPLFYRTRSGNYNTAVSLNIGKYIKQYTVVLVSKPGIPFSDSLRYQDGRAYYPDNEVYNRYYSLDWRANAASGAINYLFKKHLADKKRVIVMGYSEGSQVAPKVALINSKVTHVICFVGNALNQLYDFIIEERLKVYTNQQSAVEAQQHVDSLFTVYTRIYNHPQSTTGKWFGATYLKWSSFSNTTPLENMLKLKVPILYIAGGKDNNQTIIDMDYARLEFMRKGKNNLTYKVYPECNHYLQQETTVEGKTVKTDQSDEAHEFAINWTTTTTN